jgi:hypothetical protein
MSSSKAYLIGRMLSQDPANGLSSSEYRRKIGVMSQPQDLSQKARLKLYMKSVMGGLSEAESQRIIDTNPYLQVSPDSLQLGHRVIDFSNTERQVQEVSRFKSRKGVNGNAQMPDFDREYPFTIDKLEEFSNSSLGIQAGESEKRKTKRVVSKEEAERRASTGKQAITVWQQFYAKTSRWPVFDNMEGKKKKAVSLLYKHAKENGVSSIIKFQNMRFKNFEEFSQHV